MTQSPEQTTPSPTWQEQFDHTFPTDNDGAIGHRHDGDCEWQCAKHRKIKQFIQTQIDQAYRQGFDYALGEIKSLECTNESHEKLKAEALAEVVNQLIKEIEAMQNEEHRDGDFIDATAEIVKLINEKYMEGGNEL